MEVSKSNNNNNNNSNNNDNNKFHPGSSSAMFTSSINFNKAVLWIILILYILMTAKCHAHTYTICGRNNYLYLPSATNC